jgi:iron-sulfur cluster assembly protein
MEITDIAQGKIKEVLDNNPGKYLRVVFSGIGWGGPKLGLVLDEPKDKEKTTLVNGIEVLISDEAKHFADASTIDYIKENYREGFTIGLTGQSAC